MTPATAVAASRDADWRVRAAAVRVAEPFLTNENALTDADWLTALAADQQPRVAIQVLLSAQYTDHPDAEAILTSIETAHPNNEAIRGVAGSIRANIEKLRAERERLAALRKANERLAKSVENGRRIYTTLCITCHGDDGKGKPSPDLEGHTLAPSLVRSDRVLGRKQRLLRILLHGLTGPVDGKTYTELMVPMGANDDRWIASVANYVRNSWSNRASFISPEDVAAVRETSKNRRSPWTLAELHEYDPVLRNRKSWKLRRQPRRWRLPASDRRKLEHPLGNRQTAGAGHVVSSRAAKGRAGRRSRDGRRRFGTRFSGQVPR